MFKFIASYWGFALLVMAWLAAEMYMDYRRAYTPKHVRRHK